MSKIIPAYKQYLTRITEHAEGGPGAYDYYAKKILSEMQKVIDGDQTIEDAAKNTPHINPKGSGYKVLNYLRDNVINSYPN